MRHVVALSDAAILYGAQRYFDGLHSRPNWKYRHQYREEDDRLLFLEFLHNLCLYDAIYLDKRPIGVAEGEAYEELSAFLRQANVAVGSELVSFRHRYGTTNSNHERSIQRHVCGIVASYVKNGATAKLEAVKVPWAYYQPLHHDRTAISELLKSLGVSDAWLPFTLFVWRAVWYGAVTRAEATTVQGNYEYLKDSKHKSGLFSYGNALNNKPFPSESPAYAYVAAPGRIAALEAVFDANVLAKFKFPREAVRALSLNLRGSPRLGYDFSYLDFVSPFETSQLAVELSDLSPEKALKYAAKYRKTREAKKVRFDWADILFEGQNSCVVGTTIIQIMRDMNVGGDAVQSVRLRATPVGQIDDAYPEPSVPRRAMRR